MRKYRLLQAVGAALLVLPLGGTGLAAAEPAAAGGRTINWQECGTEFKGECATIKVPVDWAQPNGATFDLAIGRLRATEPQRRIGALFANPGGPGGSGIDSFITGREIRDDSVLRKRFDIISWDPRGVERSNPVRCTKELLEQYPTRFPASAQQFREVLAANAALGTDCRTHTGPVFDHVDTVSTVRDMDAIRAALGERKISYLGWSYGSQVGQQYAELFPGRVRAMTLDSNIDHSQTSAQGYLESTTKDFEGSFREFAAWCERTPACALYGRDVVALWDRLHAKAEAGTLVDPTTGEPLDGEAVRGGLFGNMYSPAADWFPLAARLAELDSGVVSPAARKQQSEVVVADAYQSITCQDFRFPVDGYRDLKRIQDRVAAIAPHTKMTPFWSDVTYCLDWPARHNNPQHRLRISGTPTILLTASKYDVATPRDWNEEVARQIGNSVLLNYDGAGHAQYFTSACVRGYIDRYLTTLRIPAPSTHCAPEYPTEPSATAKSTSRFSLHPARK